ncbi:MAG: hypothetical protein QOH39_1048 [Verrucomicrobiota bacterium]
MAVVLPVVVVVDTAAAAGELVAAEVESAPGDPDPVLVPLITIAEACITRTRAPASSVLRFVKRPPLPDRISAGTIQARRGKPKHPGAPLSIE